MTLEESARLAAEELAWFLLEDEGEDDILLLARQSVSKLTGIPQEQLAKADRPSGCTAATAVLDKKVLLIMSLCRALDVTLRPEELPEVKTVSRLADLLRERVGEKGRGGGKTLTAEL